MQDLSVISPIQELSSELMAQHDIQLYVKRDDLVHPAIMGNKWRKLKYNITEALRLKKSALLTFGGAFSNHISAVAIAASTYGLKSIGYIMGDELNEKSNYTLREASRHGMQLHFVPRQEFRELKNSPEALDLTDAYLLPEGGTNELAIKGVSELIGEINIEFDQLVVPMGTGGTMAGVIKGLEGNKHVLGFPSLKGDWIDEEFDRLLINYDISHRNYTICKDYHFGGYGKFDKVLIDFINNFYKENNIRLEPIYTGKMFFGVWDMTKNAQIASGTKLLCLHTGGLQGISGFNERFGDLILNTP